MGAYDEYFSQISPQERKDLKRVLTIAKKTAGETQELISYGKPALKYHNKHLILVTANHNHMSVHPYRKAGIKAVQAKLKKFDYSAGTIRFTHDNQIPEATLKKMITARMKEIDQ